MTPRSATADQPLVIKVGGSLLTRDGVAADLRTWLTSADACPERKRVLIVGGGPVVEGLRAMDRDFGGDTLEAHRAAIAAMDLNSRLLQSQLPDWTSTEQLARVRDDQKRGDWLFIAGGWLRREEPSVAGRALPTGWRVTSDSIAARVATFLGGGLILLKSAQPPPGPSDLNVVARAGYVDEDFPQAAATLAEVRLLELPGRPPESR